MRRLQMYLRIFIVNSTGNQGGLVLRKGPPVMLERNSAWMRKN